MMQSSLHLEDSTDTESDTADPSASNLCIMFQFWNRLGAFVLIFKAQICTQDAWVIAQKTQFA